MGYQESEQERLKRLRDKQIQTRDPLKKKRRESRQMTAQYRAARKAEKGFFKSAFKDVSHKAKGAYLGAVLGLITMIVLPSVIESSAANIIGLVAIPCFVVIGVLIGASLDWRDEIREHMK